MTFGRSTSVASKLNDDRLPGLVADMDDPPGAVRGFQAVDQFVFVGAVELDAAAVDQDFIDQSRPFFGEDARRLWRTQSRARPQNIFDEQIRQIVQPARDDPAL